jgi:hypothetical protein
MRRARKDDLPQAIFANMLAGGRLNHPATSHAPTWKHDIKRGAASGAQAVFSFD